MRKRKEEDENHTILGVAQLIADHLSVSIVPEIITNGAPVAMETHLHPALVLSEAINQADISIRAVSYTVPCVVG